MNNKNILLLVLSSALLLPASAAYAAPKCKAFIFHNNTNEKIHLRVTSLKNVCSITHKTLLPGSKSVLSIKTNVHANSQTSDVFANLQSNKKQKFEIFLGLAANKTKYIVNEELIGNTSAYSWSNDNSRLYFCNMSQFKKNNSCKT